MNNILKTSLLLCTIVLLSGCVKDELHNTLHPDKGAVRIATDWSGLSTDATKPESYLLRVGELTQAVNGADNTFKYLLDEGTHTLLVQNTPLGITIGTTTATVETLADGTLNPLPEYLFSAISPLQIAKDDTLSVSIKMVQSIRTLTLVLKLSVEDKPRIAYTTATLTGVASSIDLATGAADTAGEGGVVIPSFRMGIVDLTRAATTPALVATLRLAGVTSGSTQLLTLNVTLTDGTVVPIETDLTEALNNFGDDKRPLTLDATLTLPDDTQEAGATGTITGWDVVDNGNFPIH